MFSSSSSFYWASVANAPNVLQSYWLIVLPLDVPDLTASLLLRGLWREILAAKGGTTWVRNDWWILHENAPLPRNIQRSFTCRKSTTWDRRIYFPSEGRRAENFFSPWKIQRLLSGLNPRTLVPKASTLPLDHRSRLNFMLLDNKHCTLLLHFCNIILPVVYLSMNLCLSYWKKNGYSLKMFEHRVRRKIFGSMWEMVTRGWGKLRGEICMVCSSHQILFR